MNAETLIAKVGNLAAPAPAVIQLLDLLGKPDADYDEMVAILARDAVLTANLLALCNSSTYGLARPVGSLQHAVLCLGYREIHGLVMALSFGATMAADLPAYGISSGALWKHSLVTALLTPRVLKQARSASIDNSVAYTAGLLHDIGKRVIDEALDTVGREDIRRRVDQDGISLLEAEKATLGCDHAEVGACLLRHWNLPDELIDAVEHHHHPRLDGSSLLSAVVHVADAIAHQSGASPGWGSFAIVVHMSAVSALSLASEDLESLVLAALDVQLKVAEMEAACLPSRVSSGSSVSVQSTSF